MKIETKNGESIYLEYMLKLYLDDRNVYMATGNIPNIELLTLIDVPSGFGREVDILECTGGSSDVSIDVYNKDTIFSQFIANNEKGAKLYKRKCELYQVTSTSTVLLFTGVFGSCLPKEPFGTKYNIKVNDYMSEFLEKKSLFYNSTVDSFGLPNYAGWWDYDSSQSLDWNISNRPPNDNELGIITSKYLNSDSQWDIDSLIFERDQLDPNNSVDAERISEINVEISKIQQEDDWIISITGHPLNVARYLIKQMYNENADWDETTFSKSQLDTNEGVLDKCIFELEEPIENVMEYMSENLFRICNVYPYINREGKLCVRRQKAITALQNIGYFTIDRNEMIDIKPIEPNFDKAINHIFFKRGEKNVREYYSDGASIVYYGGKLLPETAPEIVLPYVKQKVAVQIPNPNSWSEIDFLTIYVTQPNFTDEEIDTLCTEVKNNLFKMFATVYHELKLTVSMTDFNKTDVENNIYPLELMDTVAIAHDLIIDPDTGLRGLDESVGNVELFAEWGVDVWGEYLPTYVNQQMLNSDRIVTTYSMSEIITNSWYNSVINANNNNTSYMQFVRG